MMQLALLALWAALLIALLVSRARLHDPLFWLLLIPALVAGLGSMWISRQDARQARLKYAHWRARLAGLVDEPDIQDDGHLYEWFDEPEWNRIFQVLERMPSGARSLRKAIAEVDPELLSSREER